MNLVGGYESSASESSEKEEIEDVGAEEDLNEWTPLPELDAESQTVVELLERKILRTHKWRKHEIELHLYQRFETAVKGLPDLSKFEVQFPEGFLEKFNWEELKSRKVLED